MSLRDLPPLQEATAAWKERERAKQHERMKQGIANCMISLCVATPGALIVAHFVSWWCVLGIFLMMFANNISQSKDVP